MIHYVDKKLAQQIVYSVKEVCEKDINFINEKGMIYASTDEERINTYHEIGFQAARSRQIIEVSNNKGFEGTLKGVNIPIMHNGEFIAVIGITGEPEEVRKYANLAEKITRLFLAEQDIFQNRRNQEDRRRHIIRALLRGEIGNHDYMMQELKDFKIDTASEKRAICIRVNSRYKATNISMLETKIYQMFHNTGIVLYTYEYPNMFYAMIDDNQLERNKEILEKFAFSYKEILMITVGAKESVYRLKESVETASAALNTSPSNEGKVIFYDQLTLELLLGSVKKQQCEKYIDKTLCNLTEDEIEILKIYFEEGKSLSATGKRLFLHKNSLQYKLNHIAEKCGYNPREYHDSVLLYLAVVLLLKYKNTNEE